MTKAITLSGSMQAPRISPKWILLPAALVLLWVGGAAISVLWFATLVVPTLWKGRWRWRPAALLLTPAAFVAGNFLSGVINYSAGTAVINQTGTVAVQAESWNLERTSRVRIRNWGCVADGRQLLQDSLYESGVMAMVTLFGPMPRAYDGRYPTRDEAADDLFGYGLPIDFHDLKADTLEFRDGMAILPPGTWAELKAVPGSLAGHADHDGDTLSASAVHPNGRLWLIGLSKGKSGEIAIVDVEGAGRIATYEVPDWYEPSDLSNCDAIEQHFGESLEDSSHECVTDADCILYKHPAVDAYVVINRKYARAWSYLGTRLEMGKCIHPDEAGPQWERDSYRGPVQWSKTQKRSLRCTEGWCSLNDVRLDDGRIVSWEEWRRTPKPPCHRGWECVVAGSAKTKNLSYLPLECADGRPNYVCVRIDGSR